MKLQLYNKKSSCCKTTFYLDKDFGTICSNCLSTTKTQNFYNFYLIRKLCRISLILIFIFSYISPIKISSSPSVRYIDIKQEKEHEILSVSMVLENLKKEKIYFPEIVIKQSLLETGHFTSKICKENKNIFGIKYIGERSNFQRGERNGHAYYDTYLDCIKDYKRLQKFYLQNIERRYAEDKSYISKLLTIK